MRTTDCAPKISLFAYAVVDFQPPGERSGVDGIRQEHLTSPSLPTVLIGVNPIPHATPPGLETVDVLRKPFPPWLLGEALTVAQKSKTIASVVTGIRDLRPGAAADSAERGTTI